jgi:hypothetical protein
MPLRQRSAVERGQIAINQHIFAGFQTVHSFFILFLHYSCAGFLDGSHFCSGVAFVE